MNSGNNVPQAEPVAAPVLRSVNAPNYISTYSNNVAFAVNAMDFVLIFGEVIEANTEEVIVERRARVTMTPIQAKILRDVINAQIASYEERTKTSIHVPRELISGLGESQGS
jgi:Protein of unknown function (DUF3467)